ncbi:GNAT family N-acetyltransferase [Peptostreptococcus canis]|uniref:GNAT family N-acetyltransferase n=1 Tax=Peptostreptococcus canis TaxID=1159213 RepID=A0ABR6TN10_9FIRM|nr:GNAT family N-acetyltransferase [Peptostreptococcus canis]MBC2576528.1 GNAT family N-acetyltransferase [Peptostreptococcus canis]MBP1998712.1 putative acetyltransferase [Peptostreptococcus canis]
MDIRICKLNEKNQIRKIWEYCFNDSPGYVDFYFENKFDYNNTMVLDLDGNIISSIHLNQHTLRINSKKFDVSYVVGVSTLPEARGMGMMDDLMKKSILEMKNRGQMISILMPIDFRLYRKYGYTNCYNILVQSINIFDLKKFKINGTFKPATENSLENLEEIYRCHTSRLNGYSVRDTKYYKDFIKEMSVDSGYLYINYRGDEPVGYISYSIDGEKFIVRECYYKDVISYKSILKYIFNHNTQCKYVEIYSDLEDPLIDMLDNPKDSTFSIKPFMMARILDFKSFINSLELFSDSCKEVKIKVHDNYIDDNNGKFRLFADNNLLKISKLDDSEDYEFEFSIDELTSIFMGYSSIDSIMMMKNIMSGYEKLSELVKINSKTNHINEYV